MQTNSTTPTATVRYSALDRDHAAYLIVDGKEVYLGSRASRDEAQALADSELHKELAAQQRTTLTLDQEPASSKAARAERMAAAFAQELAEDAQRGDAIRASIAATLNAKRQHVSPDQLLDWLCADATAHWLWHRAVDHALLLIEQGETPHLLNRQYAERYEQARQRRITKMRKLLRRTPVRSEARYKLYRSETMIVSWAYDAERRQAAA